MDGSAWFGWNTVRELPIEDKELYKRAFGGVPESTYNINVYLNRINETGSTQYAPKGDYYRDRFIAMAATGVIMRGAAMGLQKLLQGLPIKTLRRIASGLGCPKFRNKADGARFIAAAVNGDLSVIPSGYDIDSFFRLEPLTVNQVLEIGRSINK